MTVTKTMTEKQLQANRRNSQKSTGPRTEKGKHRSSRNALQHGLNSAAVITSGPNPENPQEYADLLQGLLDYWQPEGRMETELVRDIADDRWRLGRARRFENGDLMRAAESERYRRDREERESVRRGEAKSTNKTRLGMLLVQATASDIIDELTVGRALAEDIIEDLKKLFPADLAEAMVTDNSILIELAANDRTGSGSRFSSVRERMIANLKNLPLDEWQKAADQRHEYQQTMSNFLSSIPGPEAMDRLLRYETTISRRLDRTITRLERLQSRRKGEAVPPPLKVQIEA
jgi:hypothetical protein